MVETRCRPVGLFQLRHGRGHVAPVSRPAADFTKVAAGAARGDGDLDGPVEKRVGGGELHGVLLGELGWWQTICIALFSNRRGTRVMIGVGSVEEPGY